MARRGRSRPRSRTRLLAAIDFETDPFRHGRTVRPFQWGFFNGTDFVEEWHDGPGCAESLANYLKSLPDKYLIVAHNGGKFDFLFLLPWIDDDPKIISGRIVECKIGRHILRDSYAILPVKLGNAAMKKDIDYAKLELGVRHRHRQEITDYLEQDCRGLYGAVAKFRDRFGNSLTMAGAAMNRLKASVEKDTQAPWSRTLMKLSRGQDQALRPWYFGGRVSCFEKGLIPGKWEVKDVTSMYPDAMRSSQHPTGRTFVQQTAIDDRTDFALIDAWSDGALPHRAKNGSLDFPTGRGLFHACGPEIRMAMELGKLRIFRVVDARRCTVRTDFAPFVDEYFALRQLASAEGDEEAKLHWKLVLNSAYGRFALDGDKLYEWRAVPNDQPAWLAMTADGWEVGFQGPHVTMWRRSVPEIDKAQAIMNVATGASITSAARAKLLHGLAHAERPIYCDTDSIICRSLGLPSGSGLGQWKHEADADTAAIAGKKLYALFAADECVKMASKGVRLTAPEIRRVAQGEVVSWQAEAPTFNIAGGHMFLRRDVRMTI